MAVPVEDQQKEQPPIINEEDEERSSGDESESEIEEDEEDDEEEEEGETANQTSRRKPRFDREKMDNLFRRISTERVPLRVHNVIIKGNTKTKDWLIEAEVEALKNATTVQELLQAASIANARLHRLDMFDSVNITLDAGPPELPETSNVVVEVVETKNPLTGDIGIFSKPEVLLSHSLWFNALWG